MLLNKAKLASALARIVSYDSFIVQATVLMIVNYDRNMFIVQATGMNKLNRTVHTRHLCRKTVVLSCHRCLINTGVEKMNCL